ncbi:MAG: N-6 DNA methylase [Armatimonadota bacterium]|nr:N-6 DNA methylase [Armatimonadota bacterium]
MSAVKNELQAFYTKSDNIVWYMTSQLDVRDGNSVLDPCAGDGVFVDGIRQQNPRAHLTAWEINPNEVEFMSQKYAGHSNVEVNYKDALLDSVQDLFSQPKTYDRIIANPPYGAWQDYSRRSLLRSLYSGMYVRETYGLFLYQCINLLNPDGRLVFIIPDTFMHLHLHRNLRKHILQKTAVERIVVFPSKFFPGVNFGYANLCIITLRRLKSTETVQSQLVEIISGLQETSDLAVLPDRSTVPRSISRYLIQQTEIMRDPNMQFPLVSNLHSHGMLNKLTIGDIADVVTGFYSGDDKTYLRRASCIARERYAVIDTALIAKTTGLTIRPTSGIEGPRHFVPIVKGGAVQYVKPDHWFMDWSKEAVYLYKHISKKARFQNSQFYFREGIAVPMVTSSRITAALIEHRLFDQSIVGVFPHDTHLISYLLAFFNSPTCDRLIKAINPTANNSANYIKRIPIRLPSSEQKTYIDLLVDRIVAQIKVDKRYCKKDEEELHRVIEEINC